MKKILFYLLAISILLAGCSIDIVKVTEKKKPENKKTILTWEEFLEKKVKKIGDSYNFEGDIVFNTEEELKDFYNATICKNQNNNQNNKQLKSTVKLNSNGNRQIWDDEKKLKITYCISDNFDEEKNDIINKMERAAAKWENHANIEYKYVPSEDDNASTSNNNVALVVRPATDEEQKENENGAHADANYPSNNTIQIRIYRSNIIECVLIHELGHTLGLVHENLWWDEDQRDFENKDFDDIELLTSNHDHDSIMTSLVSVNNISNLDSTGIRELYGNSPLRYTVLFKEKSNTDNQKRFFGLTRHNISVTYNDYKEDDYRISQLKGISINGDIRYYMVMNYYINPPNERCFIGYKENDFVEQYNRLKTSGWRIYSFDVFRHNNINYCNAVLRITNENEKWITGYLQDDFVEKYRDLSDRNYRLHTLHTYNVNGSIRYAAVWKPGTFSEEWAANYSALDFRLKHLELEEEGWYLYSLDVCYINRAEKYSAIWRKNSTSTRYMAAYNYYNYYSSCDIYDSYDDEKIKTLFVCKYE